MNELEHIDRYQQVKDLLAMAESVVELDEFVQTSSPTIQQLKADFATNVRYCAYSRLQSHYSYYKKILQGVLYTKQEVK